MKKEEQKREEELRQELLDGLDSMAETTDGEILDLIDDMVMREGKQRGLTLSSMEQLRRGLFCSVRRLDVLQDLLDDPDITEIMVNGYQNIFYEKNGRIRRWSRSFPSRTRLEDVIQQIAGWCNRVVNEQRPIVDARLPDGSRVNVVLNPVSIDGPAVTIRRFPEEPITMDRLVKFGSLTNEAASFLKELVEARYSLLVGGGTSTGKTTFLNALSSFIPSTERVVTIEDNAELQIQGVDNLVRLEARSANLEGSHEITIRDLIITALRMRPDRIVIGEVRGAEAGDFLVSLNTGHDGSLGTAHANSVRDMIGRLEMMVLMGASELPVPVIRRQIASGVEIMIHLSRDAGGRRRLQEIAEITGMKGDEVEMVTLFRRGQDEVLRQVSPLVHTEKMEKLHERKKKEGRWKNPL